MHGTLSVHWRDAGCSTFYYGFTALRQNCREALISLRIILPPGGKRDMTFVKSDFKATLQGSQTISLKYIEQMLKNKVLCKTNDFVVFSFS